MLDREIQVCEKCGENKVKLTRRSTRNYTYQCICDGKIVVNWLDQISFSAPAAFKFVPLVDPEPVQRLERAFEPPCCNPPKKYDPPQQLNPQPGDLLGDAKLEMPDAQASEVSGDAELET